MRLKRTLIALMIFAPLLMACAGHHHRPHGAKLSKAMEKASDDYKGERKIETGHDNGHHHHRPQHQPTVNTEPEMVEQMDNQPDAVPSTPKKSSQMVYTLAGGMGQWNSGNLDTLNHVELAIGVQGEDRHRYEAYLGFGWASPEPSEMLAGAIEGDVRLFSLGLRYKYFFTPSHTFLGCYLTTGLAWDWMFWSYRNEIVVDGHPVKSDYLNGAELFLGAGINVAQTRYFQIGLEAVPTLLWQANYTYQGFENDIFDNHFLLKLRLSLSMIPTPRSDRPAADQ